MVPRVQQRGGVYKFHSTATFRSRDIFSTATFRSRDLAPPLS